HPHAGEALDARASGASVALRYPEHHQSLRPVHVHSTDYCSARPSMFLLPVRPDVRTSCVRSSLEPESRSVATRSFRSAFAVSSGATIDAEQSCPGPGTETGFGRAKREVPLVEK